MRLKYPIALGLGIALLIVGMILAWFSKPYTYETNVALIMGLFSFLLIGFSVELKP